MWGVHLMKKEQRETEIVKLLLKVKETITVNSIAEKINVSNKTIRNDLKEIEKVITSYNLQLIKKPGVGISIKGNESEKTKLLLELKNKEKEIKAYSKEDRKNIVLTKLFFKNIKSIQEICDNLYVSRTTVKKDLEDIQIWLKGYYLDLKRNTEKGLFISGEEKNYRNAFVDFLLKLDEDIKRNNGGVQYFKLRIKKMKNLKRIIDLEDYFKLEKFLIEFEDKLKYDISEEAFNSLMYYVIITVHRIAINKEVSLQENILNKISKKNEYLAAEQLSKELENLFNIKVSKVEKAYLCLHILGFYETNLFGKEHFQGVSSQEREIVFDIAKEIIEVLKNNKIIDLESKEDSLDNFIAHLIPIINRVRYGIVMKNPYLEDIKDMYPEFYGIAWLTRNIFQKHFKTKISEEDMGYLASYIATAVENEQKLLKCAVICLNGSGFSQLLLARLKKHFKNIEIAKVFTGKNLKDIDLDNYDFLISTTNLEIDKDILIVNPILLEEDIININNYLRKKLYRRNE